MLIDCDSLGLKVGSVDLINVLLILCIQSFKSVVNCLLLILVLCTDFFKVRPGPEDRHLQQEQYVHTADLPKSCASNNYFILTFFGTLF